MFSFIISPISQFCQQPLQDTKAGEGKRPRNVEDYLAGLLREIFPVKSTLIPGQGRSKEKNTKAVTFTRRKYSFTRLRSDVLN